MSMWKYRYQFKNHSTLSNSVSWTICEGNLTKKKIQKTLKKSKKLLKSEKKVYYCKIPNIAFPYLSLPFLTFPYLSLPFLTFPYL